MPSTTLLALAAAIPLALSQTLTNETVLGVYMFHRHGDRTAKLTPPANLTALGFEEVYTSGQYYRSRYISADAPYRINGIQPNNVKLSQIAASAPVDNVLQSSAIGFLAGLYPPVGSGLDTQTLRNGTNVTAPLNGFQLIPVEIVGTGGGSEDNGWLQSASGCAAATVSSNNYFTSPQYMNLLNSTQNFYSTFVPVVNQTFTSSQVNFKNAYTIYDLINVAEIHNATIQSADLLTTDSLLQLRTLADTHEWGLAYNASDDMRAIAGMQLAAEIVQFLNGTIAGHGAQKFGVQFGAYATFASFFGLADLPSVDPDFYGIADYASAMTFELFTNTSTPVSSSSYPTTDEIYVRFLWHNGTTSNISEPAVYPLFGSGQEAISWIDFTNNMNKFSVGTTQQWCTACGNFTGTCAAYAPSGSSTGNSSTSSSSSTSTSSSGSSGNGLSPAVNGVIGAMVTLAVILGVEALVMVLGGLRLVKKPSGAGVGGVGANGGVKA